MKPATKTTPFERIIYMRAPTVTLASGIVLAEALVAACPDIMPPPVKKAVKHLAKIAKAAKQAWADRHRVLGLVADEGSRVLDQEADGSWSNLRSRLVAYASLSSALFPLALRAREIVDSLFGEAGLGFLRDAYVLQWSTMSLLLKRIDDEGLAPEINKLAGPEFLAHIRDVHPRYEAMVRLSLQREATQTSLLDHVRLIQRAVVAYATQVCATVDDEDDASIEAARDALAAIEKMRLSAAARRAGAAEQDPAVEPPVAETGTAATPAPADSTPKANDK